MNIRTAAAIALLMAALGCSSDDKNTHPPTSVPINDQVVEVAADLAALRAQMDAHQKECMAVQGFPFFADSAGVHLASLVELYSLGILSLSVDDAEENGYTNTGSRLAASSDKYIYFESQTQAESDAYQAVLFGSERRDISTPSGARLGIPVGGCLGDAAKVVYGSIDSYASGEIVFNELQSLMGTISMEVQDTDEFKEAVAKWGLCMSDAGFDYDDPVAARDAALATRSKAENLDESDTSTTAGEVAQDDSQDDAAAKSTPKERRIAVADATCQAEVSLPQAFTQAALIEQARLTKERDRVFLSWDELMERVEREGYGGVASDSQGLLSANAATP